MITRYLPLYDEGFTVACLIPRLSVFGSSFAGDIVDDFFSISFGLAVGEKVVCVFVLSGRNTLSFVKIFTFLPNSSENFR